MSRVPSGRVHNLINIAAYSVLAAGVLVAAQQNLLTVTPLQALHFTVGFFVGTFLLSPDLDLAEGQVDSKRRWGWLGFLWVPYGMLCRHRGLSHTWLVGPLTRLAYLAVIAALLLGLLRFVWPAFPVPAIPQPLSLKLLLPLLAGYYLSQWLHLIADGVRPDHGLRQARKTVKRVRKTF
ncbi:Predicted membrane-bound metal-dependent hydrolase [Deinococcus geothermalis DSM 11300]|uniref:Predicted membrane-bound metal-dependent hydrolase n=1 Tax=Deinococcus geothermalis (strain DSM 11300 / CIP 105573 / AG-3a) TaxID=319795 RepID=Q1IZ50_DEIGD|nr:MULTISPECIES: metal-binding protein [Deinococcus]ABF45484.1 Predicted membrane-bound metal-dependent hydrolase [Deinococcus geothermalis DSM 11300]MBI0445421.1 hydrolase [Deinococcus sp. DB0503]